MTADNSFELFINGRSMGTGDNFHHPQCMDVAWALKTGANVITVTAENIGDQPNPAGLIGSLAIRFRDGGEIVVNTDRQWKSSVAPEGEWNDAMDLGAFNLAPWNLNDQPLPLPDIYPDYAVTARVLSTMGVAPDLESDGTVRYLHRQDGDTDIYFVANRENRPTTPTCRFRVAGRQPAWWNPLTGERRRMPEFQERDGVTIVPLEFAPMKVRSSCSEANRFRSKGQTTHY